MPATIGRLLIDPGGISTVISITGPAGGNLVTYTTGGGSSAHTFPETISTVTAYHFTDPIECTVSAQVNGVEIASGAGSTMKVRIERGTGVQIGVGYSSSEIATAVAGISIVASNLTLTDGDNIILGTTTGSKIGTAVGQKLGFYNATPVVQAAAYTQTNSTAARTVANATSSAVTKTSVAPVTTGSGLTAFGYTQTQADAISLAVAALVTTDIPAIIADNTALRADVATLRGLINSLINDSGATTGIGIHA